MMIPKMPAIGYCTPFSSSNFLLGEIYKPWTFSHQICTFHIVMDSFLAYLIQPHLIFVFLG